MKILLTATVQSHIVQFHKPLIRMLHAHGCEVHVAARNNLAEKNGLRLDFVEKVYDIPFVRSPKSPKNIRAYRELKRVIDEGHYDVVHCNTPVAGILTRLAARKARKQGTRVIYTAHGFHFYKGAPRKNWLIWYPVERFFADHFTDTLITITDEDYALARKKFRCRVEHIPGVGVDEKRYFPVSEEEKGLLREKMGFSREQRILLNVGELLPNKNQVMAIRMMPALVKEFPDILLLIAGNGREREHLEREIALLNMNDHVRLLGYVTNLQEYQRIADVLVACSYREGLGLNVIESLFSGTPVVATDNRGHRELIKNDVSGYIIPLDDGEAMLSQVRRLLSEPETYARICSNELSDLRQYSYTSVGRALEAIYYPKEKAMEPLVSVIVPVYNVENYLPRCLDSILGQTYTDFEMILVDDGSTDGSGRICDEYAGRDPRIKVIHKENGGQSSARNTGLDAASGSVISFVDSDDCIAEDYIGRMVMAMEETQCRIVQCGKKDFRAGEECVSAASDGMKRILTGREAILSREYLVSVCCKLYEKSVFDGIRFQEGIVFEDEAIYYRLAIRCEKVCLLSDVLYFYFQRPGSTMNSTVFRVDFFRVCEDRIRFFEEMGDRELAEYCKTRYCITLALTYIDSKRKKADHAIRETILKQYRTLIRNRCMHGLPLREKVFLIFFRFLPEFTSNVYQRVRR